MKKLFNRMWEAFWSREVKFARIAIALWISGWLLGLYNTFYIEDKTLGMILLMDTFVLYIPAFIWTIVRNRRLEKQWQIDKIDMMIDAKLLIHDYEIVRNVAKNEEMVKEYDEAIESLKKSLKSIKKW